MKKYRVTFAAVCSVEIESPHKDEVLERFHDGFWDSGDVDIHTMSGIDVEDDK